MAYTTPTVADLVVMYPAFATVPTATIAKHIEVADSTGADGSWREGDRSPAVLALAAHRMALMGIGDHGQVAGYARQGVTSLRSGNFAVSLDADAAKAGSGGGLDATPYGREYARLLGANKSGPRVISTRLGLGDTGPVARQNNGWVVP